MGMFDTFLFKKPLFCPYCGEKHESIQSKAFGKKLKEYTLGSTVPLAKKLFIDGKGNFIRKEDYHCNSANVNDKGFYTCINKMAEIISEVVEYKEYSTWNKFFYIVIKHSIFIGVTASREDAEFLLNDTGYYFYEG